MCRVVLKVVLVFEQRDRYEQLRGRLMLVVESVVGRRMENGRSKGIAGPSVAESFAVTSFIAMSKFAGISVGATASQPPPSAQPTAAQPPAMSLAMPANYCHKTTGRSQK